MVGLSAMIFASKEEYQAFKASLTEWDKPDAIDAEAEARAEQTAASLPAYLDLEGKEEGEEELSEEMRKKGIWRKSIGHRGQQNLLELWREGSSSPQNRLEYAKL